MIDTVDKDKDYKLDQTEFTELLKPELIPFSRGKNCIKCTYVIIIIVCFETNMVNVSIIAIYNNLYNVNYSILSQMKGILSQMKGIEILSSFFINLTLGYL